MQKKEKVIAVRLTAEELAVLEWAREKAVVKTMSQFVNLLLKEPISDYRAKQTQEIKRLEAAAKRAATRQMKKAANDTI